MVEAAIHFFKVCFPYSWLSMAGVVIVDKTFNHILPTVVSHKPFNRWLAEV